MLTPVPSKVDDSFGLVPSTRSVSLAEMDEIILHHVEKGTNR